MREIRKEEEGVTNRGGGKKWGKKRSHLNMATRGTISGVRRSLNFLGTAEEDGEVSEKREDTTRALV